jgi:hypothetical protein
MIKLIRRIKNDVDVNFDDITEWFVKSHDFANNLFDIDDEIKKYLKEKALSHIDKIKESYSGFKLPDNDPIESIRNFDYYEFGWSDKAKELFESFIPEGIPPSVVDYVQSVGSSDINFTSIHDSSNIDLNFGHIDSDIFDIFDSSDNIDLVANISNNSEFLDTLIDIGGEALDASDIATTFGISIIASWAIAKIFKNTHNKKAEIIQNLSKQISPKMKLLSCIKNNTNIENAYPIYQKYIRK